MRIAACFCCAGTGQSATLRCDSRADSAGLGRGAREECAQWQSPMLQRPRRRIPQLRCRVLYFAAAESKGESAVHASNSVCHLRNLPASTVNRDPKLGRFVTFPAAGARNNDRRLPVLAACAGSDLPSQAGGRRGERARLRVPFPAQAGCCRWLLLILGRPAPVPPGPLRLGERRPASTRGSAKEDGAGVSGLGPPARQGAAATHGRPPRDATTAQRTL
jgi:hypothetical protein